jgi:hypothetical protein
MNLKRNRLSLTITSSLAATLVAATILVSPTAHAADSNKLVVMQDAPTLATAAHTEANTSGAVLFFAADLRNTKRKKIGEVIGQVTTIDVTLDVVGEEDRFRELVFNMKDGQIVVLGAAQYTATTAPNFAKDNAPVTAVIVGGTGDYIGARGIVTTKKLKNGTYRHTFKFVN